MPTEALTIGPVHSLVQNQIYALPARRVLLYSDTVVEVSNTIGTTGFTTVAASTTGVQTSAAFIRCTSGVALVTVKA